MIQVVETRQLYLHRFPLKLIVQKESHIMHDHSSNINDKRATSCKYFAYQIHERQVSRQEYVLIFGVS